MCLGRMRRLCVYTGPAGRQRVSWGLQRALRPTCEVRQGNLHLVGGGLYELLDRAMAARAIDQQAAGPGGRSARVGSRGWTAGMVMNACTVFVMEACAMFVLTGGRLPSCVRWDGGVRGRLATELCGVCGSVCVRTPVGDPCVNNPYGNPCCVAGRCAGGGVTDTARGVAEIRRIGLPV